MLMDLPVARYHFHVRTCAPLHLPDYAGSLLRGAFGHSLRRMACMARQKDCAGCPLQAACLYLLIFETPSTQGRNDAPNLYVIEPPATGIRVLERGADFRFAMVLIGPALDQLALIVIAWKQALERGLSGVHSPCQLQAVYCENDLEPVFCAGQERLRSHRPNLPAPPQQATHLHLRLLTPLRLQKDGQRVGRRELDARTLLITLARRAQALCDLHHFDRPRLDFPTLIKQAEHIKLESDLRWFDWTRYSNRQQREMTLGGLLGELHLHGELDGLLPLLYLGQWLHLGKNASFGLGHYQIQQAI